MTASRHNKSTRQEKPTERAAPLPVSPHHRCYCDRPELPWDHEIGDHVGFYWSPPKQGVLRS